MFNGRMTFVAALLAACEMTTAGSLEAARLEHNLQPKTLTPIELKTSPAGYVMKFVDEGELRFAIVRDARYDKAEHWTSGDSVKPAVDLLVEAFEKTTGKRPAVLDAEKDSEKIAKCPYLLLVGNSRYVEEQGFDWKTLPIEGFAIKTFPKGLMIVGCDTQLIPGWHKMTQSERGKFAGTSCGTKFGASDFVERFLGCRFYFPAELGKIYPPCKNLTISPVWYEDHPLWRNRSDYFYTRWHSDAEKKSWAEAFGKMDNVNSFLNTYWRFGKSTPGHPGTHCPRPELMMKIHSNELDTVFFTNWHGKRWMNPKRHEGNFFDVTNLKFADLLIEDWKKIYAGQMKADEGGYIVSDYGVVFGQCDTWMTDADIRKNETVRALGLITERNEVGTDGAIMNDVYARFLQYLAKRVNEEFPGRRLSTISYYNSKYPPSDPKWTLPSNVDIYLCDGMLPNRVHSLLYRQKILDLFQGWYRALGNRPVRRVWIYSGCGRFMGITTQFVADIPKLLGKYIGDGGVYLDTSGGKSYWYHYYGAYVAYRAQWNWNWDYEAALDEQWMLLYGPKAGPAMKEFHRLLKKAYFDYCNEVSDASPVIPLGVVAELESALNQAVSLAEPGSVEARRLGLFTQYWPAQFAAMRKQATYEIPYYNVKRTEGEPTEEFWATVEPMPLVDPQGTKTELAFPRTFKLAWNERGVYGRFETEAAPATGVDKSIWSVDSCEFFLSPGLGKELEHQFVFDVHARTWAEKKRHLPIPQSPDSTWKPQFDVKCVQTATGWKGDFFVAFKDIGEGKSPVAYDQWKCNFVANKVSTPRERASNSLCLGNNHNRDMWGIIRFLGKGD